MQSGMGFIPNTKIVLIFLWFNYVFLRKKSNEVNKSDLKQDIQTKDKDYSVVIETLANKFIWLIGILFVLYFILNYIKSKTTLL